MKARIWEELALASDGSSRLRSGVPYCLQSPPAWLNTHKLKPRYEIGSPLKSMTCKQLAGACDLVFTADTFDEIATLSQQHGREMFSANDGPHVAAMEQLMELMKSGAMDAWMADRKAEFGAL